MARIPSSLRQVELRAPLVSRRKPKDYQFRIGIAANTPVPATKFAAARVGPDLTFPPIIPRPIVLSNGDGALASDNPVQLIFWGSAWNDASTNPAAGTLVEAVRQIVSGPYLSGLRQYGIKRCPFGGALVVTSPEPPALFKDGDVHTLIGALIDDNHFPEPDEPGGRNIYSVFMPPGTSYSGSAGGSLGARGAHSVATDVDLPTDVDSAWVAWIGTNTLDQTLSTFTHELVEMCTDPESDAWKVNGQPSGLDEIGDVCNGVDGPLNGLNVESYWSAYDNACLIPTAWSVRRTLAGAGKKLNGKGLRSLQDPIPSLNQFLVNL